MKSKMAIFAAVVAALLLGCTSGNKEGPEAEPPKAEEVVAPELAPPTPAPDASSPGESVYESPEAEAAAAASAAANAERWLAMETPEIDAPSHSGDVPVRLSLKDESGPAYSIITYLVIQSVADEVAISAVEVNRGNCAALMTVWEPGAHYPTHEEVDSPIALKFGAELKLQPSCRSILEAKVATNLGDYEFSFADAY